MAGDDYVLGLDLGTRSLGWAVVTADKKQLKRIGVRVFDAGANPARFAEGRPDSSNTAERRRARLQRRQIRRRAARHAELFALLQFKGLLPGPITGKRTGAALRHEILHGPPHGGERGLDQQLQARVSSWYPGESTPQVDHLMPYLLRARALDHRLEREELGRALYSLGQRRGYWSNRKAARLAEMDAAQESPVPEKKTKPKTQTRPDAEEKKREVLEGIANLERRMKEKDARTLAEYFAKWDPRERPRIRTEYTARDMFQQEFEKIWAKQAEFHEILRDERFKQRVYRLLFYQRSVATNKHLIGHCRLEPSERRAPMSCLEAQRFRLLQKVNDTTVIEGLTERELTHEEKQKLAEELEQRTEMSCRQVRHHLNIISDAAHLNLERAAGKLNPDRKVKGNRTAAHMWNVLGDTWKALSPAQQDEIVRQWMDEQDGAKLSAWAQQHLCISEEQARRFASKEPEDGYSKLSLKALRKILPIMEQGIPFKTAEERVYGNKLSGGQVFELLPPLDEVLPHVPNPAVKRALTELRKTVNAIIRERKKKPLEIRIELARDLKRNMEQRRHDTDRMEREATERKKLKKLIAIKLGIDEEKVSPQDIEKVRLWKECGAEVEKLKLWEECRGTCPYTGQSISFSDLFGSHPRFDVEHILPKRRFADDSFQNKTLCEAEFNRRYKAGNTPSEACGKSEQWEEILTRVRKMGNAEKLRRFQITSEEELAAFSSRALNDTRYASVLAAEYLGALYGGRDEEVTDPALGQKGKVRRVYASTGIATAALRRAWQLEAIVRNLFPRPKLNQPAKRTDHRHHAVDALIIALTSQAVVQRMSAAAAAYGSARGVERVTSRYVEAPWQDFVPDVQGKIAAVIVSHRVKHRLFGNLHDANAYGVTTGPKGQEIHKRRPVWELTKEQIDSEKAIVDPAIARFVKEKLAEVGDPKKFKDAPPQLRTKTGKTVPIYKVRVKVRAKVVSIGNEIRERNVSLGENHHISIFIVRNSKRQETWDSPGIVSRKDAMDLWSALKKRGRIENLVRREWPHSTAEDRPLESEFLFSLMPGDMVEMSDPLHPPKNLFLVRTISQETSGEVEIDLVRHTEARQIEDLKRISFKDFRAGKPGEWIRIRSVDQLRLADCRKVLIDVLGGVRYVHD